MTKGQAMNQRLMDIETIRQSIKNTGEIRLHITYGRTGFVRARMWHADGFTMGTAGGGGYDKRGTAIANALAKIQGPELLKLAKKKSSKIVRRDNGTIKSGLHGMGLYEEGKVWIDGGCGVESVRKIVEAMGWTWDLYDCGKSHDLLILRRKGGKR